MATQLDPSGFMVPWSGSPSTEIIEASQPDRRGSGARMVVRFPVQKIFLNPVGTLHGAAQAAIHDICSAWVMFLVARSGFWEGAHGATRTLNMTFLQFAREGDVLLEEVEVIGL